MGDRVRTDRRDHVLCITLHRPDVLNAIDPQMAAELCDIVENADRDRDVRALLITGAGRGFCAGADVAGMFDALSGERGPAPAGVRDVLRAQSVPLASALMRCEKPIVAAVNGPCAGAGLGVALACDVVVAGASATFSAIFVRRGLVPDYGVTFALPRLVGLRLARELCLTGRTVNAEEAVRIGLASQAVADEVLADTAARVAADLAAGPGVALGLTKRLLGASFETSGAEELDREFTAQALCFASDDAREGLQAFLDKRAPQFHGR